MMSDDLTRTSKNCTIAANAVDGGQWMTDLHARILAVQLTHLCDSYEQDMGQCPCGFEFSTLSEWAAHVTDALLGELGRYE